MSPRLLSKPATLALLALLAILLTAQAQPPFLHPSDSLGVSAPASPAHSPGVALAEGFSQLTGVAISPLLGVTASGIWQYYHPTPGMAQPWYAHPVFWSAASVLLCLVFLKDVLGTAVPGVLKKPFDMAELFENKLSGMVACGAFVPLLVMHLLQYLSAGPIVSSNAPVESSLLGAVDFRLLAIPLAMIGFLIVWLASHAINVLIVLCPFSSVDALLKLFKAFLLSSIVLSSLLNPWFGAAVSLLVFAIALSVAPWAFRLLVFGSIFATDVLLPRQARHRCRPASPHAFSAGEYLSIPARTFGRLSRDPNGSTRFSYRPWLILSERHILLPPGQLALVKGVLHPSLLHRPETPQRPRLAVLFLPRYRTQESAIASHFGILDIQENRLARGLQAIREWIREFFSFTRSKAHPTR